MTTIELKPMDTADLEDLRRTIHPVTHPSFAKLLADRDYHEQRAEQAEHERDEAIAEIEVLIGAARKATGASADEEPEDVALHLLALCEELDNAEAEAADLWVGEQRVKDVEAERDQALAEVARLRARVRVAAEDVEHAGLVDATVMRYLTARGWTLGHRYRQGDADVVIMCQDGDPIAAIAEHGQNNDYQARAAIAFIVGHLAKREQRSQWDILDEMAAMPLESEP